MKAVLFHIDYIFTPQMVFASLLFALTLSTIASLAPALGAARLRVGQVLRYE
jgi:ABC-type lipoprotein release transport system permease subunit